MSLVVDVVSNKYLHSLLDDRSSYVGVFSKTIVQTLKSSTTVYDGDIVCIPEPFPFADTWNGPRAFVNANCGVQSLLRTSVGTWGFVDKKTQRWKSDEMSFVFLYSYGDLPHWAVKHRLGPCSPSVHHTLAGVLDIEKTFNIEKTVFSWTSSS